MPFPNFIGNKRFWTRERVLAALAQAMTEIPGPLPCMDAKWSAIKKGRLDWPVATRVLSYYHSMARAWLAAGADPQRVSLHNQNWMVEEDEYLLTHAGEKTLQQIAAKLGRSYQAVRARLSKTHHTHARWNQGPVSAAELAKEYNCSCQRIRTALAAGRIKGHFDHVRNRWQVDLAELTPEAKAILTAPKQTHKTSRTDLGDYYQRYGLKRTLRNGKLVSSPVKEPVCV